MPILGAEEVSCTDTGDLSIIPSFSATCTPLGIGRKDSPMWLNAAAEMVSPTNAENPFVHEPCRVGSQNAPSIPAFHSGAG